MMRDTINHFTVPSNKISLTTVGKINKHLLSFGFTFSFSLLSLAMGINSSLAGDPFRTENQRNIGDKTEAAFKALFEEGNYPESKNYLREANEIDKNDPMISAMRASLAYTEQDWETMNSHAIKTIEVAENIKSNDPLRGNLYLAVGNFLEGAYIFQKEGPVAAITKLQQVLIYLDAAEKFDAKDPELNLIKGYLNLFLAVKLPFSSAEEAIERLENYAAPKFLVNRGIAIAYRDLKKYDRALEYVELAIESTPLNPELYYLRGQILRQKGEKGQKQENLDILNKALKNFDIALEKQKQLPLEAVQKPLARERRKTQEKIEEIRGFLTNKNPEIAP